MTSLIADKIALNDGRQIVIFEDHDYVADAPELPDGVQLYTYGYRNYSWYSGLGEHYYTDQDAVIAAAKAIAPNDKVLERIEYDKNGALGKDESAKVAEFYLGIHALYLDLYGYNHSGQAIRLSPFGCRWDSGRIGLFAMSRKKARQKYGHIPTEDLYQAFEAEVQPYIAEVNQILTGCWYGCRVQKDRETLDSCYGFDTVEAAKEYALSITT